MKKSKLVVPMDNINRLKKIATDLRIDALKMTSKAGSSHIGSMYSIADIIAVLFFEVLEIPVENVSIEEKDYFILSKGHAGGIVLAALSRLGFFSRSNLEQYCQNGSMLSGHISHHINGVDFSTGSLGHGLPVAAGIAYGLKLQKSNKQVFVLMSDGELNEGSNWEAIMFAAHHQLSNLKVVLDKNNLQSLKSTKETLDLGELQNKFREFGWTAQSVDGHCVGSLLNSFLSKEKTYAPSCFIAKTTKGKGVSFMENSVLWHYRSAKGNEFDAALKELEDQK